jgi:hypothetical protein
MEDLKIIEIVTVYDKMFYYCSYINSVARNVLI